MLGIKGKEKPIIDRGKSKTNSKVIQATPLKKAKVTYKLPAISNIKQPKCVSKTKKSGIIETPLDIALKLLNIAPDQNCGYVNIRFNHYNKTFRVYNGVLKWSDVDNEYCFSFIYRGNYNRDLFFEANKVPCRKDDNSLYFIDMVPNQQYYLRVEEDPLCGIGAEGLVIREGPIKVSELARNSTSVPPIKSGNFAVKDITKTLLSMKSSELQSDEAIDLKERRDIEDILFS